MTTVLTHRRLPPLQAYEIALRGGRCTLEGPDHPPTPMPVQRWRARADASDRALLSRCTGRTVDLGCGPGRMAEELGRRGHTVLGVDVSAHAVRLARSRGVHAVRADVLHPLPGEGRWDTALLADGNIGIGGDPARLLTRVGRLLAPGGRVVVDLAGPGTGVTVREVRLVIADAESHPFPWAMVGVDAVHHVAASACLGVRAVQRWRGRWFAVLTTERETPWPG